MRKHTRSVQIKQSPKDSLSNTSDQHNKNKLSHSVEEKLRKSLYFARATLKRIMSKKNNKINENAELPMLRTITAISPAAKLRRNSLDDDWAEKQKSINARRRKTKQNSIEVINIQSHHNPTKMVADKN